MRQVRNFFMLLLLANGTHMFVAGDEFAHTQHGDANPWTKEAAKYLDWTKAESNSALLSYVQRMIAFRKANSSLIFQPHGWGNAVSWSGADNGPVDWAYGRCLTMRLSDKEGEILVLINGYWEDVPFTLPPGKWMLVEDTAQESVLSTEMPATYTVTARSIVLCISA